MSFRAGEESVSTKEIKMTNAISDRALDLGVFALDNELEVAGDGSDSVCIPFLKEPVSFSPRRIEEGVSLKVQAKNFL
jgi:hypothetical protein